MSNGSNNSMLPSVLGSAAAGIVARTFTHPLDTAKARLQAPPAKDGGHVIFKGPIDTLRKTYSREGIRGLYRGFPAVIIGGTPGTMLYLCSYEFLKTTLSSLVFSNADRADNFALHFTCGMLAETIACIIYVPVDVVKERMQVQQQGISSSTNSPLYKNSLDALVKICRNEGARGIYKGYAATLASFGPFSALYFMFYEQFKHSSRQYLSRRTENDDGDDDGGGGDDRRQSPLQHEMELPFSYVVLSSCSAGALASWLTSPLDMAKLRLQIQRGNVASNNTQSITTYRGVVDCLRFAYRNGGVQGLFRGAWARVLHFAPATTITMTCYETFRAFFAKRLSTTN